ncbi:MAG: mannonate dehydratase [Caldilineaceae bacterium]|nr:mannonate dehydratase [Caldilineaceae bacterium]
MTPGTRPTTRPLVPVAQRGPAGAPLLWNEEELRRIITQVERFGLQPVQADLPLSGNIVLGRTGRDADLAIVKANIALAGKLGLQTLTYNFTALRASEGYGARLGAGRGGADLRDFDNTRIADLPPLPTVGEQPLAAMWERIADFLWAVIPVAEAAEVRLAVHPNDPPVPIYRGVAQPLADLAGLQQLVNLVDSSANCIFFDTGVTTEMGEDVVAVIRSFGERKRIGAVHFRNVCVTTPSYQYLETFQDEGDCNMAAAMRALHEVGYVGLLEPDHTPGIDGDTADTRIGWAFAIGQMIALRQAAQLR